MANIYADADQKFVKAVVFYPSGNKLYEDEECTKEASYRDVSAALFSNTARICDSGSYYTPTSYTDVDKKITVTYGEGQTASVDGTPVVIVEPADPWFIWWEDKRTAQLQSDIKIEGTTVTGTLHYVTDFTGYTGGGEPIPGYYLCTHYIPESEDTDVHVFKTNGVTGDKILSRPDLALCSQITDKETQKLQIYAERNGVKGATIELDLSGLTLEEHD